MENDGKRDFGRQNTLFGNLQGTFVALLEGFHFFMVLEEGRESRSRT